MLKIPCRNCDGKGKLEHFSHVEDGICFKCNGSRFEEVTEKEYEDSRTITPKSTTLSDAEKNEQMEDEYRRWFNNYPLTFITFRDQKTKENKREKFKINGKREEGFYIEIDGNKVRVKAVFKRKKNSRMIHLSEWRIA